MWVCLDCGDKQDGMIARAICPKCKGRHVTFKSEVI
jgi:rubrerythrin